MLPTNMGSISLAGSMTFGSPGASGAGRVRLADPTAGVTANLSGGPCACALDAVLPIVPSDAVVIAASVLAVRGELWIWLVAVAAAAGGFLGDTGSYVLGRTAGAAAARRLFRSPKAKGRLTWAGEALDRHGATIIVVARFVPGGRTATTFTAGTVRQPWPSFAAADAVGATLWAAYAAGLSYVGGETFERRSLYGFCSVWASPCWAPLS